MRYSDITNEWINAIEDFDIPDFTNGINVGFITTSEGNFDVLKIIDLDNIAYGVKSQDKIVCYIGLLVFKLPYVMAKNAITIDGFRKRGITTSLLDFIVQNEKLKIFSDYAMTENGGDLWKSIIKKSLKSTLKIADLKTETIYDLNQIGGLFLSCSGCNTSPSDVN